MKAVYGEKKEKRININQYLPCAKHFEMTLNI